MWDAWVARVVDVVVGYHGDVRERPAFLEELGEVRARPLPPRV